MINVVTSNGLRGQIDKKEPLSVTVPALNEQDYIGDTLKSVAQAVKRYSSTAAEVVVVDNGSTDKTGLVVESFVSQNSDIQLKLVTASPKGVSVARNVGADYAEGKYLCFIGADSSVQTSFLDTVASEMRERNLDVAGCRLYPDSQNFIDQWIATAINLTLDKAQNTNYPIAFGSGLVSTRELHRKVRGFDSGIRFGEDLDYAQRSISKW